MVSDFLALSCLLSFLGSVGLGFCQPPSLKFFRIIRTMNGECFCFVPWEGGREGAEALAELWMFYRVGRVAGITHHTPAVAEAGRPVSDSADGRKHE